MEQKNDASSGALPRARRRPPYISILIIGVCYLLLTIGMILTTSPDRYSLSAGDIAPATITATKDVVDEVTTNLYRDRAAENVQLSYREDDTALEHVLEEFSTIFQELESIRSYGEKLRAGVAASASGDPFEYTGTFPQADLVYAHDLCASMDLSDWQLTILMKQTAGDIKNAYENASQIIARAMQTTILEGQLEAAINNIQKELPMYIPTDLCWNIVIPVVRECLIPNMVVNQEATEANREAARHAVEPTMYKIGQNIVRSGERVTLAQIAVLRNLGILEGNRFDVMMMAGVSLLGALAVFSLLLHILQFDRVLMSRAKNALMLAVIFFLTMGISMLTAQLNVFLLPVSMVVLLVATLLSPSLAITCNILALIIVSVLTNSNSASFTQQMLSVVFAGVLAAPIGILVARRKQQRASILLAGLAMAAFNLVGMIAIGLLTNNELVTVMNNAVWSAGGNLLAAILCMGVQPMLEGLFNLVTPYKLLELANPNQPLLRRLLVETPGTYHHSILVANLAEAAAEAVGADPLLTRVGAYYHDIGKLKRPQYFKENQLDDNPHDRTDPRVSAAIIAEHVTDGIAMARQQRLPEAIVRFIAEHHGDTQISFFYLKMRNMPGGENAQPEDFQYPGPKPQSAETAIMMLADTAEAAVRAGGDQSPEAIEQRIRELIKGKIEGGQLNESELRFADVSKIIRAFALVLAGIYHKRIEYPKLDHAPALPAGRHAMQTAQPVVEELPDAHRDTH